MSTDTTLKISSTNSDATERLGEQIGKRLRGGEVIELVSDLGGGKTTFVRGLAWGMGSSDHVSSPTFTISKIYKTPQLQLHHFDFYRLPEAGVMYQEIHEVINDPLNVTVIEWAGVVEGLLPQGRLIIEFKVISQDVRQLTLSCGGSYSYLLDGFQGRLV